MKIRTDFVTNSSSSSFIIAKKYLDNDQLEAIRNHVDLAIKLNLWDEKHDYAWDIDENEEYITGYVFMDNFYMPDLFEIIEIDMSKVEWGEYRFYLNEYCKIEQDEEHESNQEISWRDLL